MNRNKNALPALLFKTSVFWVALQPMASVSADISVPALRESAAAIDAHEQSRQRDRERVLEQQMAPKTDIRLTRPTVLLPNYPASESPCSRIHTIQLAGDAAGQFQWALDAANGAKGRCLGAQGIQLAIDKVQNAILAQGYVTTRVTAQEQDLSAGILTLQLQPGRIANIQFEQPKTYRARLWNAMPADAGDILNLRDIEQTLENFKRVPNADADIKIVPGEQEGTSNLLIAWKESRPFQLRFEFDDSGSKGSGKYQGSSTLTIDSPFAHNDLFYVKLDRSLFRVGPYDRRSYIVNYSIPMGYWRFAANYSDLDYYQNTSQTHHNNIFSGQSKTALFTLSRLVFRNQAHRTTLNMRIYRNHYTNTLNGQELPLQYRRTAGWEFGLTQRSFFDTSTLDANINWRRGTGAFGALRAPEEIKNAGSARTGTLLGDISLNLPLPLAGGSWRYFTSWRGQWSNHPLTPQERLDIGGRYTVRGFDGEQKLSGEKGLIWSNELAWKPLSHRPELYWGLDYGRVYGPGTRYLTGRQLAGSVVGLRGPWLTGFSYDFFAGVPLLKPDRFHTSGVTTGFSLNLQI